MVVLTCQGVRIMQRIIAAIIEQDNAIEKSSFIHLLALFFVLVVFSFALLEISWGVHLSDLSSRRIPPRQECNAENYHLLSNELQELSLFGGERLPLFANFVRGGESGDTSIHRRRETEFSELGIFVVGERLGRV
jgi:hypothetical protein